MIKIFKYIYSKLKRNMLKVVLYSVVKSLKKDIGK